MRIPLFRRIGLMILSVALAALVWLLISGEQVVERALRIPLEFANLPARLEFIGETPSVVDVRVRGSSGALGRVAAGELVAVVDLRSATAGQGLFHLSGSDVRAPFGIDVVQVSPSNISMTFEASASKRVPIVPRVEGEPARGFAVESWTVDPVTVEVVGPASVLGTVTEAITGPVSVAGAARSVTATVNVGVSDPTLRLRSPQRARVTVTVVTAR